MPVLEMHLHLSPIHNRRGVEQGGVNSGNHLQLVNNKELNVTNNAALGLNMGGVSVGSIASVSQMTSP